jgi:hypothetical protein
VKAAGILKLPPRSDASAKGTQLEATRPASPPDEPPQDLSWFNGFKEVPHTSFSVCTDKTHYIFFKIISLLMEHCLSLRI